MMTFPIGWIRKAALVALLLVATSVAAHERQPHFAEPPMRRALYFSTAPQHEVPELFVSAGIVTTLRFESDCDPSKTKLLGWEGRFEPLLVGGRSVVIVPLKNLDPDDRLMLLVTLMDGTSLPFTVKTSETRVDGQVTVFPKPESPEAVRAALEDARKENDVLRDENRRQREEGTSVDHALAALLLNEQIEMTPFREGEKWVLRGDGVDVEILIFVPRKNQSKVARKKAAVVFNVKNKDPLRPWELQEARLSTFTTWQPKPFALRTTPSSIPPGKAGRIAIVTDLASFDPARDGRQARPGALQEWRAPASLRRTAPRQSAALTWPRRGGIRIRGLENTDRKSQEPFDAPDESTLPFSPCRLLPGLGLHGIWRCLASRRRSRTGEVPGEGLGGDENPATPAG